MKHLSLYVIGVVLFLTSCELHRSTDGLDGFWQLCTVDTLATGGTTDMRESQQTWCVQGSILEVRDMKMGQDFIFSFNHTIGHLTLFAPYISKREEGDIPITDPTIMNPWGIYHLEEHFDILENSSTRLVLRSDRLQLTFRSY